MLSTPPIGFFCQMVSTPDVPGPLLGTDPLFPPAVRLRGGLTAYRSCLQKVDHVTDYCVPDLELNRVNFGREMEKMSKSLCNKPEDLNVLFQPLTRLLLHAFSFKGL